MRSEFSKGLDYANSDIAGSMDDMLKSKNAEKVNPVLRILNFLARLWAMYSPLSGLLANIKRRYD
jgi:hypothetical protein